MNIRTLFEGWQRDIEAQLVLLEERVPLPVFSAEEKLLVLQKAREYVEASFTHALVKPLVLPTGLEKHPVDIDICFWVRGELRASMIIPMQLPLEEALPEAVRQSLSDRRFAPLQKEELSELRLECVFLGGPWRKLTRAERQKNEIDPTAGFVAYLGKRWVSWYVPPVHNCIAFRNLDHMMHSLLREKGKLSETLAQQAVVITYPTSGFVENSSHDGYFDLCGPLVIPNEPILRDVLFERAIQSLLKQETQTGIFTVRQIPRTGAVKEIDWVRLGFTGYVLAEIGRLLERPLLIEASLRIAKVLREKSFEYLLKGDEWKVLTSIYAGLAAFSRRERELATEWLQCVSEHPQLTNFSPVTLLHLGSLHVLVGGTENVQQARILLEQELRKWYQVRDKADLSLYPQIIFLAEELYRTTKEIHFHEIAISVSNWFVSQQQSDGSFPSYPGRTFSYTRGTGKIFESLATLSAQNESALEKALEYLSMMQYSEENMFHIPKKQQANFLGGFRHDAFDRSVWIDSAGHIALGFARWLNK